MRDALHAEWTKLRTAAITCPSGGCAVDSTRLSLTRINLGQALVAVLAGLAISGEYSTGMIRVTLTAMPRRTTVLAGHGFTPAHGYPPLSLTDGPTLRAAAGSVFYLALVALFSLGAATAVRDSATAGCYCCCATRDHTPRSCPTAKVMPNLHHRVGRWSAPVCGQRPRVGGGSGRRR